MLTFQDHVIRQKVKDSASSPEEKAAIGPYIDSYAFLPFGDLGKRLVYTTELVIDHYVSVRGIRERRRRLPEVQPSACQPDQG